MAELQSQVLNEIQLDTKMATAEQIGEFVDASISEWFGVIPEKTTDLVNDSGFATSSYVDGACRNLSSDLTGWVEGKGYLSPEDVSISYDESSNNILLASRNSVTSVDCAGFIKDGMISDVVYDENSRVISILWNADGGAKITRVCLSGLMDTYAAGSGLKSGAG